MKITLNTNKEKVQEIRQKLKENDGYCPCHIVKKPEYKCMCKEFIEQKQSGFCHCELYYKDVET